MLGVGEGGKGCIPIVIGVFTIQFKHVTGTNGHEFNGTR